VNRRIKKQLVFQLCFLCAVLLMALAFVRGLLSPRGWAVAMIILVAVAFIVQFLLIRKAIGERRKSPAQVDPSLDSITSKVRVFGLTVGYVFVVFFALLLVFSLLRHGPLPPKLKGATISLCAIVAVALRFGVAKDLREKWRKRRARN
jgi:glucan phosphoethanolaminetransferase (alkaline phosphatase superfamily)